MKNTKCHLCEEEIKETFLGKINGTIITKDGKKYYFCSKCQKEHGDDLKKNI